MIMDIITEINIWFVGLCLVSLGLVWFTHYWYRWSNPKCINGGKLPPGSMGFPLIGESIQLFIPSKSLDMPSFVKKRISRYGPIFKTSLAGRPIVVSADPEFSNYIFQQEGKLVQFWYLDSFAALLGDINGALAVIFLNKYFKNLLLDHFGIETLKDNLLSKIQVHANQSLRSWSTQSSVELRASIASMVFDVTAKQLFSYDPSKSSTNMSDLFVDFLRGLMSFPLNVPGTAFHQCLKDQKRALDMVRDIVNERINSCDDKKFYGDMLDQALETMKKEELVTKDLVVIFIFGSLLSIETIAATLTVGLTLLTEAPSIVAELTEEHEAILRSRQDKGSLLTWKEYKSMTFTSQVINEILRMTSVAPGILRKVIKDIPTRGYVIPKGWTIMVVPSALQMNPDKFKDPLTFNPHRWNKDLGSNSFHKSFIPFGGGSRNCAGSEFSKAFLAVFLHVMVTKFSWTKIKGGDAARTPALSLGNGFHVKISQKKTNQEG